MNPGIQLPGGVSATRWLSQGASTSAGWPLAVEGALNSGSVYAQHCLLNLSRPEIGLDVLTDELDPGYQHGLPWILSILADVTAQVTNLGAKALPGWVLLDLETQGEARRIKKVQSWCARQGLDIAVLGEIEGAPPPGLTVIPFLPLSVIQDVTAFLNVMEHKH